MASFQSSLEETDIADELAAGQRAISVAEFFEKNKHMLGFDSEARALVTAVKEACDNSLTWSTPFVYRRDGETRHAPIGQAIDELIEQNRDDVQVKRDGELEKLPVSDFEALSFDDDHQVDFRRVSSVFRHRVNSDIFEITVEGGRKLELTDYHSVFVLRQGEIVSVETSEIDEDDCIVLPDTEWGSESIREIDLIRELHELTPDETEPLGLHGVTPLIEEYDEEIRSMVHAQDRINDFRKCDRLPFNIARELDLEPWEYEDCQVGYRFGNHHIPAIIPVNEEFASLLGLYVAEGCVPGREHRKVFFSLGSHGSELIEYTEDLIESVFGIPASSVKAHETATNVRINSKIVGLLMQTILGGGARPRDKKLPRYVLDFPSDCKEQFMLGYLAGDGYPSRAIIPVLRAGGNIEAIDGQRLTLTTSSDHLASGLRYLLSSIRFDTTHERKPSEPRNSTGKSVEFGDSHVLYLHTDQRSTAVNRLPSEHSTSSVSDVNLAYNLREGQTRIETDNALTLADGGGLEFSGEGRKIAEGDLTALPVSSIERIDYDGEWVYDVSVPGNENFIAGTAPLACHNSLDATEEAGFLPDIYIEIREDRDYYTLIVEDNGPGVTKEQLPKIFGKMLYGSRFHVREMTRGQQGIGISAAVLYAQLTSGTPAKITSRTPKASEADYFELIIDTEDNEPEIQHEATTTWDRPHGTRIELTLEANMRARQQLHDYITHTAIVNPHARIELNEPDASFKFDRATDELPAETSSIRPHPHGVELGTLIKMLDATDSYSLSGFLQGEFTRVGGKTADDILDAFRDRHFGREVAWGPPRRVEDVDLARSIQHAVANKGAEATAAFAERVAEAVADADAVAHHELVAIVDESADVIEEEFDSTFGSTVRENAIDAGWAALTADRVTPLFDHVREATSSRKDEDTVRAFVERLAPKFDDVEHDRVPRDQLDAFVDRAAEKTEEYADVSFGGTARENVLDALWAGMRRVPDELPAVNNVTRNRDAAADLLEGMRAVEVMAPPTDCLSPITADLIEEGLRKEVDADYYTAVTRDAEVHGGDPFIVEAGIAFGGELQDDSQAELLRFANRVPLVYQQGACAITDVVRGIDWRNYGLDQPGGSGMPGGPAMVLIHVASTNVPFTSESKDAVANIPTIEKQVELAVREAARGMKSHLNKRRSLEQRREKQSVIADILPKMASKVATVTGRESPLVGESLARIMNNVLVAREANGDCVDLVVENHTDDGVDLELSEVLDHEPQDASAGRVVELDDEWVLKWAETIGSGETASLSYEVDTGAESDLTVDGPEPEKLTIQA